MAWIERSLVARIERSEIREGHRHNRLRFCLFAALTLLIESLGYAARAFPDFASLNPGYGLSPGYGL